MDSFTYQYVYYAVDALNDYLLICNEDSPCHARPYQVLIGGVTFPHIIPTGPLTRCLLLILRC